MQLSLFDETKRKKKLTKETEEKIVGRAFAVLLVIVALVTVLDIVRIMR